MTQLSTLLMLRLLAAAQLVIAGTFRLRGDPEQAYIFSNHFGYPSWTRVAIGALQLISALCLVVRPGVGVPVAATLCVFMMLSHALRQGIPLSGVFDFVILLVVSIVGLYVDLATSVPVAMGVGVAVFLALWALHPKKAAPHRS